MMPFLYFPEDKTEYIPAVISLVLFMIGACVALYLIYKHSKKQEKKFDEQYKALKVEKQDDTSNTRT
jgi:preprotein translocase subunit YajC